MTLVVQGNKLPQNNRTYSKNHQPQKMDATKMQTTQNQKTATKKNDSIKFKDLGLSIDITNKDTYPYAKLLDLYLLKGDVKKKEKLETNYN